MKSYPAWVSNLYPKLGEIEMGYGKDMWIAEHNQIGDDYADDTIDFEEAISRLRAMGFNEHEAHEQLKEIKEDKDDK